MRVDIPEAPGYSATADGQIWSCKRKVPRALTPALMPTGHLRVCLSLPGGQQCHYVHRLVLQAFVGPCPDGLECRHLNGDPTDNRVENLAWGTPSENRQDMWKHAKESGHGLWMSPQTLRAAGMVSA